MERIVRIVAISLAVLLGGCEAESESRPLLDAECGSKAADHSLGIGADAIMSVIDKSNLEMETEVRGCTIYAWLEEPRLNAYVAGRHYLQLFMTEVGGSLTGLSLSCLKPRRGASEGSTKACAVFQGLVLKTVTPEWESGIDWLIDAMKRSGSAPPPEGFTIAPVSTVVEDDPHGARTITVRAYQNGDVAVDIDPASWYEGREVVAGAPAIETSPMPPFHQIEN